MTLSRLSWGGLKNNTISACVEKLLKRFYTGGMIETSPPILEFKGPYRYLSNFWMAPVLWAGQVWPSTEHAYQAAKTLDGDERRRIRMLATPGYAKRAGKLVTLRPDWEQVKEDIMLDIVLAKFSQHPRLMDQLLSTGDAVLEEGNNWRDTTWGVCPPGSGQGRNLLGKILMDIRFARGACVNGSL